MKKLFSFALLLVTPIVFGQDLYKIKLVDSIPLHFNFATDQINNLASISNKLDSLSTYSDAKIIVNAYTDSVGTIEYNEALAERRLAFCLNLIQPLVPRSSMIYSNNQHEKREFQPIGIDDTLFRRVDVLVYQNQLTIEYNKPYPLPINFDGNQYFLRDESKVVIDKMIAILEKHPALKIELHGHVSGHSGDYQLSLNRTLSVKEYMVQRGIADERIKCIGFDNKRKLYFEQPWENNPLNRRVEIIFVE